MPEIASGKPLLNKNSPLEIEKLNQNSDKSSELLNIIQI